MMRRLAVVSALVVAGVSVALTLGQEPLPRFRSGANLVGVDAYFTTKDGKAVTDLKQEEIEIFEDDKPQSIQNFRMVRPPKQGQGTLKANPVGREAERDAAQDPEARVFVLFFDQWHVSATGSSKAAAPVSELLNRVIGPDDLVGMITPEDNPRNLSLTRRTAAIERMVRDVRNWGDRDSVGKSDPREREIEQCYPDDLRRPLFRGVAKEMIERRRERKTLDSLAALTEYLGNLREERKFVVILSEGWVQFRQNDSLGAIREAGSIPGAPPSIGVVDGRIATGAGRPEAYDRGFESCERERQRLAFIDDSLEIRQLAQRANRANVTFFAVDPRGLAVFDDEIGPMRPAAPPEDRSRMADRQGGLRELAGNTDGAVVLNTNDVKGGVARIMAGLETYYLMQYYSTNTKLDGRFRSIRVRVKRPGVTVRSRSGYLAPTEAEARAGGVSSAPATLPAGIVPIVRRLSTTALRRGPSTGLAYVRATEPRFRRTERLRIEVMVPAGGTNPVGRLLNVQKQALPLIVTYSTQITNGETVGIADVTLAPLAAGEYSLELTFDVNGQKESASYEFRIVP